MVFSSTPRCSWRSTRRPSSRSASTRDSASRMLFSATWFARHEAKAMAAPSAAARRSAVNRWLRGRADAAAFADAQRIGSDQPKSLYPVVDPDLCIGSLACLRSCPEGDVFGLVDGVAVLIRGNECIGHGRCAAECPVSAITLVFGTARRGHRLPRLPRAAVSVRAAREVRNPKRPARSSETSDAGRHPWT